MSCRIRTHLAIRLHPKICSPNELIPKENYQLAFHLTFINENNNDDEICSNLCF